MTTQPVDDLVACAVTDLAQRLAVTVGAIEVVEVEEVTWRDSSFGCPKPERMYAAVLSPGHRITLRADGQTYQYHSGEGRSPFLCPSDQQRATGD